MNIHKRCEKNVANNCGINTRDMAQVMQEMGISGDKIFPRKKVSPLLHATAVMTETYTFLASWNEAYSIGGLRCLCGCL